MTPRVPPVDEHFADELTREVAYLYSAMFARAVPEELLRGYLRAHSQMSDLGELPPAELNTVRIIVERRLDALGIEPWVRKRKTRHALSAKLLLVCYLAECGGRHQGLVPAYRGRLVGWWTIVAASFRAVTRMLRGRVQMGRYGLV